MKRPRARSTSSVRIRFVLAVGPDLARLDPRWNCMRGIHRQHAHNTRCWGGAFIRHYPGGAKPWDDGGGWRGSVRGLGGAGASRGEDF